MTRSVSPQSPLSAIETAVLPDDSNSNSGSSHGAAGEYSTLFHLCTPLNSFPLPTAGSKRNADDLGDNDRQPKRQRTLAPVAMADGNLPLKKTWEMTELKNRRGLLAKFRVGPLDLSYCPMSILTFKGPRSLSYGQEIGTVGQLGRPNVQGKSKSKTNGESDLMCNESFSSFPGPRHLKRKAIRGRPLRPLSRCRFRSGNCVPDCNTQSEEAREGCRRGSTGVQAPWEREASLASARGWCSRYEHRRDPPEEAGGASREEEEEEG